MILLNEDYNSKVDIYHKGTGSIVYSNNKSFIDLSCGAGTLLLGHNSSVRTRSIKNYLKLKLSQFSHPNISAIQLSKNLKKVFPQFDKFILCNTGAEANTKALRIARAVSGKNIVISVTGSWHGSVDQFLFNIKKNYDWKNNNEKNQAQKLSDGVDPNLRENLKYIPFNNIEISKKILNKYKKQISCIFVEPVQGGLPTSEGVEYLKFLKKFCNINNIILSFDEILTGIRVGCSSVQNIFNIKTDISTFGKVIGGGMPIGIIGLKKNIVNKLRKKKVFFGGTYSGNSLSAYVANETLKEIIKNKKKIFPKIENLSNVFVNQLNKFILQNNIDAKVIRFYSIIRIVFSNKEIKDRPQRDFFEKSKKDQKSKFIQFLNKEGIYFAGNGIIFFNYSLKTNQVKYLIKKFSIGLERFFSSKEKNSKK